MCVCAYGANITKVVGSICKEHMLTLKERVYYETWSFCVKFVTRCTLRCYVMKPSVATGEREWCENGKQTLLNL